MSRAWARRRARLFNPDESDFLRQDFASSRRRVPRVRIPWAAIVCGVVVAGLLLAALRMSILRARYQLGEAIQVENQLLERERAALVTLREARDPARLRELANQRGFVRPEQWIELGEGTDAP